MPESSQELRYLSRLAERFPTIASAASAAVARHVSSNVSSNAVNHFLILTGHPFRINARMQSIPYLPLIVNSSCAYNR